MFEKGKSGNPGGRPRKTDEQIKFERRCREFADTFGFDTLRRWANGPDFDKAKFALQEMLNRGFGRPVETSVVDAYVAPQSGSSVEDIGGEIADLLGGTTAQGSGVDSPAQVDAGA